VDYTLTGEELEQLKSSMQNSWKDFCIACLALGFPCLINARSEASQQKVFSPTLSFNLNLVIGLIGVLFGIIFLILWQKTKGSCDRVIEKIINKPKISIVPSGIGINQVMINSETIGKSNKRISKQ
jgi:nitrogen fixation/metabolism regulation signal transduction histidine kinase